MGKEFSFSDLNKTLTSLNEIGGIMEDNDFSEIGDYIPTGNYALNACISGDLFGGIPVNRASAAGGSSGVGKTFLALNITREAVNKGYNVIYYDSENAVDKQMMKKFGIDTTQVRYEPVATVWDFKRLSKKTVSTLQEKKDKGYDLPKVLLILDSLGNLATVKEHEDAEDGKKKVDMSRAKELKSVFRILTMDLAKLKIPMFLTNHTYEVPDLYSKPKFSGGSGGIYNSSVILMLRKLKANEKPSKDQKKKGVTKTGIIVKARPWKNRLARPVNIKFYINFNKGMNPYIGLHEFVNWDACGIQKNARLNDDGTIERNKNGDIKKVNNGRYVVKHLGKSIYASELFTPEVFTPDVLKQLNDNVIKDMFNFPDGTEAEDFYEMLDERDAQEFIDRKKENNGIIPEIDRSKDVSAKEAIENIQHLSLDAAVEYTEGDDRTTVQDAVDELRD